MCLIPMSWICKYRNLKTFSELYTEKHFSDVQWKDGETPIPQEMWDYYASHQVTYKGRPLDAETAKEIAKILDEEMAVV